jgi:hemerythrin
MSLLTWNEKMMLGIENIDNQHQRWITLINDLHEAMQQGKGSEVLNQTLAAMLNYTSVHFADEERLLLKHSYPGYTQHKQLHDDFIKKIKDIQDRLQKSHILLTMEIMKPLRDWLTHHIQNVDRQYAPFLKSKMRLS